MKLVIIFGPPAVGKMTVGQALEKKIKIKLFYNHMTIELLKKFFDYSSKSFARLNRLFRQEILKEISLHNGRGVIFTGGFDFNDTESIKFMNEISGYFSNVGGEVYYVELDAALNERLKRNSTENRLLHKPSKSDIIESEKKLMSLNKQCRFNTVPGEIKGGNYFKINNTNLTPEKVADLVIKKFNF